jgi:ribosomal protein S18 acetylase RimI-like enzyme
MSSDVSGGTVVVRDAAERDVEALAAMSGTRVMHSDRIREALLGWMQYLVAEVEGRVVGFGLLVYTVPPDWDRPEHAPIVVNLHVHSQWRSRGIGTAILREMESRAGRRGFPAIYLRVEPENNPRAFALYKLGREPVPGGGMERGDDETAAGCSWFVEAVSKPQHWQTSCQWHPIATVARINTWRARQRDVAYCDAFLLRPVTRSVSLSAE